MRTPASELGRFHPVSENLVLAACERAQRHDTARGAPVTLSRIAEHLGFARGAYTTRQLGPLVGALERAGALERSRAYGAERWGLTTAGRRRLRRTRAAGKQLALAEAPQHREWRQKHTTAAEGIEDYRERMREALQEAVELLEDERSDSGAWRAMAKRLHARAQLLSSAIYCARVARARRHVSRHRGEPDARRPAAVAVAPGRRRGTLTVPSEALLPSESETIFGGLIWRGLGECERLRGRLGYRSAPSLRHPISVNERSARSEANSIED